MKEINAEVKAGLNSLLTALCEEVRNHTMIPSYQRRVKIDKFRELIFETVTPKPEKPQNLNTRGRIFREENTLQDIAYDIGLYQDCKFLVKRLKERRG